MNYKYALYYICAINATRLPLSALRDLVRVHQNEDDDGGDGGDGDAPHMRPWPRVRSHTERTPRIVRRFA